MLKFVVYEVVVFLCFNVEKKGTKFWKAIPVLVRVAITLYKLIHGSRYLLCLENFVVEKNTIYQSIRAIVKVINVEFKNEIYWPCGNQLIEKMNEFKQYCGLPRVMGAIDVTHFDIKKPLVTFEDYYYFKNGGFNM